MFPKLKQLVVEHWPRALILGYAVLVLAGGALIYFRHPQKGKTMDWSDVKDNIEIKAKPDGIWTVAYEYVKGPALIQIVANDDQWEYAPGKKSTANGDLTSMLCPQDTILPSAPVGAMIAKVGGSTAGTSDGRLFVVGKSSLLQLDQNTGGPIFLTVNDELTGLQNNTGSIKVKISIKPIIQAPAANSSVASGSAVPQLVPIPNVPAPGVPVPGVPVPGVPVPGAPIPTK